MLTNFVLAVSSCGHSREQQGFTTIPESSGHKRRTRTWSDLEFCRGCFTVMLSLHTPPCFQKPQGMYDTDALKRSIRRP